MPPIVTRKRQKDYRNYAKHARELKAQKGRTLETKNSFKNELNDSINHEQSQTHVERPEQKCSLVFPPDKSELPYKLRPRNPSPCGPSEVQERSSVGSQGLQGYRVCSLQLLAAHINRFMSTHQGLQTCDNFVLGFVPQKEKLRSLGVVETLECISCKLQSDPVKLFNEVDRDLTGLKGPTHCDLNLRFALGLQISGIGIRAGRELLSLMDIPVPSKSSLQRYCDIVSDKTYSLSETVMVENQQKLRNILNNNPDVPFIVSSDTAYNNAPKGRSFYQPGTQAFCPLIETNTSENMVLSYNIANKLCKRCQLHGKNHDGECSCNYPKSSPIGNAEKVLAHQHITNLLDKTPDFLPDIVVTDNDGKIAAGMKQALSDAGNTKHLTKEDCAVHTSRSQRRIGMSQKWSTSFAGKTGKNITNRNSFINELVGAIVKRSSGELRGAVATGKTDSVVEAVQKAKLTILPCFQGNHKFCKQSFVCPTAKRKKPRYTHLPKKLPLKNMTSSDEEMFEKVVNYKLSEVMTKRQIHNMNTNSCEAFHKKIFRSVPKSNTFSRNVYGRVGAQIITSSLGRDKGSRRTCSAVKAPLSVSGPGEKSLKQLSSEDAYDKERRKLPKTKRRRKMKERQNKSLSKTHGSLYKTDHLHPNMSKEHSYAENKVTDKR